MARRRMNIVGSRFHPCLLSLNVLRQCVSPLWDSTYLRQCLTQFQLGCRVRFSMVLQLFGMMESMIAVLPLGLLKMQAFQWWSFCKVVFEDASLRGWEALFGGVVVWGVWTSAQNQLHINHLEMLAAFLAMKIFRHVLTGQCVLIRMDNTTVVSYINKQEVHYPLWNFLALCCHGAERIRCLSEPSMFQATWMNVIKIIIRVINIKCPKVKFRYTQSDENNKAFVFRRKCIHCIQSGRDLLTSGHWGRTWRCMLMSGGKIRVQSCWL